MAEALDWSLSKLIRIETGAQRVSVTDLRAMLGLYGVTDARTVDELISAARASRGQPWWHAYRDVISPQFAQYLGHEGIASSFQVFHPFAIPGLLQTGEYATEVLSVFMDPAQARRVAEFRMERQERLLANGYLTFEFILNEEALYRWVGGAAVMVRQLQHLIDVTEQLNVSVRDRSFPGLALIRGFGGSFVILYSEVTKESMAFLEGASGDQLIKEDLDSVSRYQIYFERLRDLALPADQGKSLLQELIDHHQRDAKAASATM